MVDNLLRENDLTFNQHKAFKQAEEVPPEAVIQYLKPALLARILVFHKHVLTLPCSCLQVDKYKGSQILIPVNKGTVKSTNHKGSVIDVIA
jgi:hypothetical protein